MVKYIQAVQFLKFLFDSESLAHKAAQIVEAILEARSPRLSDLAQHMAGQAAANYKAIQRFLQHADPQAALLRLFQVNAPFVIGDPTELPRPQARRTPYVGKLKDGKTRGYWLLLLATPYRGRAIPCAFVTYSSRTIAQMARSRNQFHWQAFDQIKTLLGDKPLVLDREFSYLELLEYLVHAGVNFVIRLHLGSHPPIFTDATGRRITPSVELGAQTVYHQLRYKGQVTVNVVGVWHRGHAEPLWVMSNLTPERALSIYLARTKIEETFRDLKSLLGLDKMMFKSQQQMEKMAALVMIAFAIGLLAGEIIRDYLYGSPPTEDADPVEDLHDPDRPSASVRRKWQQFSGLFILLKHKLSLSRKTFRYLIASALAAFATIAQPPPVRT